MKTVQAEAICGRIFTVDKPPEAPEELCLRCEKDQCATYIHYLYAVTHSNNP